MRSAREITPGGDYHRYLRDYDLREIDAADLRSLFHLKYLARLRPLLALARRHAGPGGRVLEVGCAQANASLLLAEAGLRAVALDLRLEALTYARAKHERGAFWPLVGNAQALPLAAGAGDVVLLAELLEHCAQPRAILSEALRVLRPGGWLLLSTPNGEFWHERVGSFRPHQVPTAGQQQRQFGREGDDHLACFTRRSLGELLRAVGLRRVRVFYAGSALLSDRLALGKRLLPPAALLALSALVNRLPGLGRRLSLTLVAVGEKPGP